VFSGRNCPPKRLTKREADVFNVGDMAVYPAHGVGRIEAIEKRDIGNQEQSFYVMRIIDSNMVIMIPVSSCDSVGLRTIIPPGDVPRVFEILRESDVKIPSQPWNQRYRSYMEKIKTGSVFKIATVLRDLYLLKEDKTLSFGERKMMDTARNLLVKELAIANKVNEGKIEKSIESIFS
jgi:CarD family transcriptional regulator